MLEHRFTPLLSRRVFWRRMLRVAGWGVVLVVFALAVGASGYHGFEGMTWLDATLNAAMILTGMGPVDELHTAGGKLFAIGYALFSGVVFLTTVALVLTPLAHRLLHRFHLDPEEKERARPK